MRSVTAAADLPTALKWTAAHDSLPGLLFPWHSPTGDVNYQLRPDVPIQLRDDPQPRKYVQETGVQLLNVIGNPDTAREVWLVEGTRQCLAAAAYAPDGVLVVGLPGCANGCKDGLLQPGVGDLIDGRVCVVWMDADIATNASVWLAAQRLGQALELEGAGQVRHVLLPGTGKQALDDLLGGLPDHRRARYLAAIRDKSSPRLPTRPKESVALAANQDGRPSIDVTGDRWHVIGNVTDSLIHRWDGVRLFDFGGVISELDGHTTRALDRGALKLVLAETAVFYHRSAAGLPSPGWPDAGVVEAVTASSRRFTRLDRVSRVPFVRPDGTVCQEPGYDAETRTALVLDEGMAQVAVPHSPTDAEVEAAVRLILDEWLGDMPFASAADRANALALVLTPFLRGLVPLVPLAVIDGLQMGVGKNLLADCVAILHTGSNADPLPFPRDDAEMGKVITSAFGTGRDLFVFDEAHVLEGTSLARALTATSWNDRILGVSQLADYPNRVTWVALGNNVAIKGDLARRVYRVALHPDVPNPESRPTSDFRHPDLRTWTLKNRRNLVTAGITLVRAWFSRGQPSSPSGARFGSFERWELVIGGILHVAKVPGLLENTAAWRGEADHDSCYWAGHLHQLHGHFGESAFTTAQVREKLLTQSITETPPALDDFTLRNYGRELGKAYGRIKGRWYGSYRIRLAGSPGEGGARGSVNRWRVEQRGSDGSEGWEGPPQPYAQGPDVPDRGISAGSPDCGGAAPSDPSDPSLPRDAGAAPVRVHVGEEERRRIAQLAEDMSRTGVRVDGPLLRRRLSELGLPRFDGHAG
ncbi:MAG: hypothetical protein ACR2FG_11810 [Marmoricola sp.]